MSSEFANIFDFEPYPAVRAWFGRMAQVPAYAEATAVNKALGDISVSVTQKQIGAANKLGIKTIAAAASKL